MLLLAQSVTKDAVLSLFKRKPKTGGITGVCVDETGFSLAHVVRDAAGTPQLELALHEACPIPGDTSRALAAAVRKHGLQGSPCVGLLKPDAYSLRQIDAPPVSDDEVRDAARWSVKDLIDFPAEDAVIDVFDVPASSSSREKRIYVVATPKAVVQEAVDLIEGSGLALTAIEISELALRNVAMLLPENERGMALIYLSDNSGVLTITQGDSLYLARRLHSELDVLTEGGSHESVFEKPELSDEAEQLVKSLLLETQRSLDYYEHQLEQGAVSALVLFPTEVPLSGLRSYLAQNLSVEVSVLELNGILKSKESLPHWLQARCLTTIGAALRVSSENA